MPEFEGQGLPAGFFTRLLAFVIDVVIAGLLAGGAIWVATTIQEAFDTFVNTKISLRNIALAVSPFVFAGYFVLLWALAGRTPGKWILGLRILSTKGANPTVGQSVIRVLGYLLSAIVLYVGFLWVLVDKERRAWHDHLAGTSVIYDRSRAGSLPNSRR